MQDSSIKIETIKRIYVNQEGVYLEIGPDTEIGTAIEIRTTTNASMKWFGSLRFILSKGLAKNVARALNEIVDGDTENKLNFKEE